MKISVISLLLLCLATCIAAGCSDTSVEVSSAAAAAGFVNTMCPIMGNPVDTEDPSMVKEWNGKKVGFCCPPCLEEWDELTDAEKSDRLKNPPKGEAAESLDHADHDHSSEKGPVPKP